MQSELCQVCTSCVAPIFEMSLYLITIYPTAKIEHLSNNSEAPHYQRCRETQLHNRPHRFKVTVSHHEIVDT